MHKWVLPTLGTLVCAVAAFSLALMLHNSSFKSFLPLLFLIVVVLTSFRFGNVAGRLGTVIAALIFAAFLFEPRLSLGIKDSAERSNLIWMVVGGIALSELLGSSLARERSTGKNATSKKS
jgi:K+-sensing histidine kinase KdpD